MPKMPGARSVAAKSEHIDQINSIMLLINTSVMPFPIIPCGRTLTCLALIFKKVLTVVIG